jgi:hypothetical protein
MKMVLRFVAFLIIATTFSCREDEGPSINFIDQDALGKIDNASWEFADGYAGIHDLGDGDVRVSVTLLLAQTDEGCDIFIPEGDMILFSVPNEIGLYKLGSNHTVTLFQETETMNFIATDGAVEILSITESMVSGRLDARYDSQTYVNGNFTVSICP